MNVPGFAPKPIKHARAQYQAWSKGSIKRSQAVNCQQLLTIRYSRTGGQRGNERNRDRP